MDSPDGATELKQWLAGVDVDVEEAPGALPDLAEHAPRRVAAILYPRSASAVQAIVKAANASRTPIYPYSTGRSWGLGSQAPVVDGCAVVDMSRMTRVRRLDIEHGYAVIEPGVSQGALADLLKDAPFMLNVTTSCRDTSVLGNTLDRGDGALQPRADDLLGLEAVLGNGELLTAGGIGPAEERRYHGLGCGPNLSHLFFQSNFGVVTAGAVALVGRPECTRFFYASFKGSALADLVDAMSRLQRQHVFKTTFRLREFAIEPATAGDPPGFSVLGPLFGRQRTVDAAEDVLREELGRLPGCGLIRTGDADGVGPDDPLYFPCQTFLGVPRCGLLRSRFGTTTCDLDSTSSSGWSAFVAVAPFDGGSACEVVRVVQRAVATHGLIVKFEGGMSARAISFLISIWFARDPRGIAQVRAMRSALLAELSTHGFYPARAGIDFHAAALDHCGPSHVDGLLKIKRVLDPNQIIAPGRYVHERPAQGPDAE
jgi:4-cresol dehydrogenase (hydroxylating)